MWSNLYDPFSELLRVTLLKCRIAYKVKSGKVA